MEGVFVIPEMLPESKLEAIRGLITGAEFVDGKSTATGMAQSVKKNEQLNANKVPGLMKILTDAVVNDPLFRQLTMPRTVANLMINRYQVGMSYGAHVDAAVMTSGHRADISFTLVLSPAESYEGGELVLETGLGDQKIRQTAGSLVLYPTGVVHRVMPVTRGERLAVVGWVESRIRDVRQRQILIDLEMVRKNYLEQTGHDRYADLLLKTSSNLRRMWDS